MNSSLQHMDGLYQVSEEYSQYCQTVLISHVINEKHKNIRVINCGDDSQCNWKKNETLTITREIRDGNKINNSIQMRVRSVKRMRFGDNDKTE